MSKDISVLHLSAAQRLVGTKKKRTAGTKVCSAGLMNRRKPMSYQDFEGTESPFGDHQARNQKMRAAAGETFSRASDNARDAGAKAKRAAEGAGSSLSDSACAGLRAGSRRGISRISNIQERSIRLIAVDPA
jgi:hypothetical protein